MGGHSKARVEINSEIVDNGGRCNNIIPHTERYLRNLKVYVAIKCTSMPENSMHKCTNAVNNVQPIRNSSHMAKILSAYNKLQAGDYENGNGGKRSVSRLIQFIHATLQLLTLSANKIGPTDNVVHKLITAC